jgi:DNA-binding transcriptional regulator YiaG
MRDTPFDCDWNLPVAGSRLRHSIKDVLAPLALAAPGVARCSAGRRRQGGALARIAALVNNYANGIGRGWARPRVQPRAHQIASENETERTVKLFERVLNPREIRRRLGLNQEQFWTQIGVTQSGGSRYESGREMPKPVRELLRLVHVEQVDLSQVRRVDFEIINYLKESHPDLYRNLRRAARSKHKRPDGDGGAVVDDLGGERHPETIDDRE